MPVLTASYQEALIVFGRNIRIARERKGMTLSRLAKSAGYDRLCLSRLECGAQNITYAAAVALAKALDAPFPLLFSRNYAFAPYGAFAEDDFLLVFSENFKRELAKQGLSQFQVYMACGLSESAVSRMIHGKLSNPTLTTLSRMAAAVNADLSVLFRRSFLNTEVTL